MYTQVSGALRQYQQVHAAGAVTDADPHTLVSLLFSTARDRIAEAKGALVRGETARKGEAVSKALALLGTLSGSLDEQRGGQLAANLHALYDYMIEQVILANIRNDAAALDPVLIMLASLQQGWDAIPVEQRRKPQ